MTKVARESHSNAKGTTTRLLKTCLLDGAITEHGSQHADTRNIKILLLFPNCELHATELFCDIVTQVTWSCASSVERSRRPSQVHRNSWTAAIEMICLERHGWMRSDIAAMSVLQPSKRCCELLRSGGRRVLRTLISLSHKVTEKRRREARRLLFVLGRSQETAARSMTATTTLECARWDSHSTNCVSTAGDNHRR